MSPDSTDQASRPVSLGIETLLRRLIDYAGLFPPAELDMATTVRNYDAYVDGEDAWMLGRLIVPAARLEQFEAAAEGLLPTGEDAEPWHVSSLVPPARDQGLPGQLERIVAFNARHADADAGLARVDVIELRAGRPEDIEQVLEQVPDELYPFFELPVADDPRGLVAALAGSDAGAKVRTGGVTANLYPTPAMLARFVSAVASARVPFKATAGLHHPVRHHSEAVNAEEFGFFNVFVGATLRGEGLIDDAELHEVLTETRSDAFVFDDEGVSWRGRRVTVDLLEDARDRFAISFGSCSFDEPRADLRALGLL
ncbi:MAG: hypothetical protein ACYTGC_06005 [Planctomycetota bacterium]|jgi:hypothetical protein